MLSPLVTVTTFDVMLMLRESAHGLVGCCVYKPHLFRATAIDRLLRDFRKVLERMLTQPEQPISTIPISGMRNCRCVSTCLAFPRDEVVNVNSQETHPWQS